MTHGGIPFAGAGICALLDQSRSDTWRAEWRVNSREYHRSSGRQCGCAYRGRLTSWREEMVVLVHVAVADW
ncbi:hypothetical protein Sjap_011493 [Stephania japonica]|uniref:Uncharacterized protein n=1 Tax=Stephania japonica TaxID=461633 RepID=A0AAP0P851_9MAGN